MTHNTNTDTCSQAADSVVQLFRLTTTHCIRGHEHMTLRNLR